MSSPSLSHTQQTLDQKEKERDRLKRKVDDMRDIEKLHDRYELLKHELAWSLVVQAEQARDEAAAHAAKKAANLDAWDAKLVELEGAVTSKDDEMRRVALEHEKVNAAATPLKEEKDAVRHGLAGMQMELAGMEEEGGTSGLGNSRKAGHHCRH